MTTEDETNPRRDILKACVRRIKDAGLSGKARDDAAGHFIAGAGAGFGEDILPADAKYIDVLEAMAD